VSDNRAPGRGKDGKTYKDGNTDEDGGYVVGRAKPPVSTRFAANDGRKRGRRASGATNLATDWQKELAEHVTSSENGRKVRISKRRAVIKRTVERAISGNDRASEMVMRYGERDQQAKSGVAQSDQDLIDAYLRDRAAVLSLDPALFGDPAPVESPSPSDVEGSAGESPDEY